MNCEFKKILVISLLPKAYSYIVTIIYYCLDIGDNAYKYGVCTKYICYPGLCYQCI